MSVDEQFMQIALEQAAMGRGCVEPNPMVGAVLVRDGREIARGHHEQFGCPHAEANAIAAACADGASPEGATLYVTLEPCCHRNKKTPPCTDAIIQSKISRVVVAMTDPDSNVAGKGIETLRLAGIEVELGLCEQQSRQLLRAYIKLRTRGRPWVICKWAQTADGYISLPPGHGQWISTDRSRAIVHKIRAYASGVLAGVGTVIADDPHLDNRSGQGRQPARLVLDSDLRTPPQSRLVRSARQLPVIIVARQGAATEHVGCAAALTQAGCEIIEIPTLDVQAGQTPAPLRSRLIKNAPSSHQLNLQLLLDELGRRQWTYLLVEGGAEVHRSFISRRLADEIVVFVSKRNLHDEFIDSPARREAACPTLRALPRLDIIQREQPSEGYHLAEKIQIDSDTMLTFHKE